jgi:hypothetical protein
VQWLLANPIDDLGVELSFSDPLGPEESKASWTGRAGEIWWFYVFFGHKMPQVIGPSYFQKGLCMVKAMI